MSEPEFAMSAIRATMPVGAMPYQTIPHIRAELKWAEFSPEATCRHSVENHPNVIPDRKHRPHIRLRLRDDGRDGVRRQRKGVEERRLYDHLEDVVEKGLCSAPDIARCGVDAVGDEHGPSTASRRGW